MILTYKQNVKSRKKFATHKNTTFCHNMFHCSWTRHPEIGRLSDEFQHHKNELFLSPSWWHLDAIHNRYVPIFTLINKIRITTHKLLDDVFQTHLSNCLQDIIFCRKLDRSFSAPSTHLPPKSQYKHSFPFTHYQRHILDELCHVSIVLSRWWQDTSSYKSHSWKFDTVVVIFFFSRSVHATWWKQNMSKLRILMFFSSPWHRHMIINPAPPSPLPTHAPPPPTSFHPSLNSWNALQP